MLPKHIKIDNGSPAWPERAPSDSLADDAPSPRPSRPIPNVEAFYISILREFLSTYGDVEIPDDGSGVPPPLLRDQLMVDPSTRLILPISPKQDSNDREED